jgi:hypothetical protein
MTPKVGTNQHTGKGSYNRTTRGTKRDYTLVRLKRDYPKLFAKVKAGEMSANAAAIEGDFSILRRIVLL